MRIALVFLLVFATSRPCCAWSEGGHHLITVMAFDLLDRENQRELLDLLQAHPRFVEDFKVPDNLDDAADAERWIVGRAGYWPDVARKQAAYNRPEWHYQLGPSLVIGDVSGIPVNPGPVPPAATLETKSLHISQALQLCRRVLNDKTRPAADRAIAVCWIAHLVGDSHQPCHAGSLYCEAFPKGDRGANSIPTVQGKNMHALWDGLLGPRFNAGDIRRRQLAILDDPQLVKSSKASATDLDPMTWLAESAGYARSDVYAAEVLNSIKRVPPGTELVALNLSDGYLRAAGAVARHRAAVAAHRLAAILKTDL